MNYREKFIHDFGALFTTEEVRAHYEGCGVESMTLDSQRNIVTVKYTNGYTRDVNVECDSLLGMIYDIIKYALW